MHTCHVSVGVISSSRPEFKDVYCHSINCSLAFVQRDNVCKNEHGNFIPLYNMCSSNCYIYMCVFTVVYVMTNNWNTELSCSIQHVNLVTSY